MTKIKEHNLLSTHRAYTIRSLVLQSIINEYARRLNREWEPRTRLRNKPFLKEATGMARCRECGELIKKGELGIKFMWNVRRNRPSIIGPFYNTPEFMESIKGWLHQRCG